MSEGWRRVFIVATALWVSWWLWAFHEDSGFFWVLCHDELFSNAYCRSALLGELDGLIIAIAGPVIAWIALRYILRGFGR